MPAKKQWIEQYSTPQSYLEDADRNFVVSLLPRIKQIPEEDTFDAQVELFINQHVQFSILDIYLIFPTISTPTLLSSGTSTHLAESISYGLSSKITKSVYSGTAISTFLIDGHSKSPMMVTCVVSGFQTRNRGGRLKLIDLGEYADPLQYPAPDTQQRNPSLNYSTLIYVIYKYLPILAMVFNLNCH